MKTEQHYIVKCTLGEVMRWEGKYGDEASKMQREIVAAFNGENKGDFHTGRRLRFDILAKELWGNYRTIAFTHVELFMRFSRMSALNQGHFLEGVFTLLWEGKDIVSLEIEVPWSATKTRAIKVERVEDSSGLSPTYDVRFSMI